MADSPAMRAPPFSVCSTLKFRQPAPRPDARQAPHGPVAALEDFTALLGKDVRHFGIPSTTVPVATTSGSGATRDGGGDTAAGGSASSSNPPTSKTSVRSMPGSGGAPSSVSGGKRPTRASRPQVVGKTARSSWAMTDWAWTRAVGCSADSSAARAPAASAGLQTRDEVMDERVSSADSRARTAPTR